MKLSWWDRLPFWPWRIVGAVESADEIPEALPDRAVVMVKSDDRPKWLCFDCPCRSGHRVMLNIDPARQPAWTVQGRWGRTLSIAPSVDYIEGSRRCHYFLRSGRIHWVGDSIR